MLGDHNIRFKQVFFACFCISYSLYIPAYSYSSTKNVDFIFEVCNDTLQFSHLRLLYIWNWNQFFPISPLVQLMHKNLISTVSIDHHRFLEDIGNHGRAKNILIVLNNLEDIISLIRDFADDANTKETKVSNKGISNRDITLPFPEKKKEDTLRQWSYRPLKYRNTSCDYPFYLPSDQSVSNAVTLSESFRRVPYFYGNRIFNGENNLVFYVYKKEEDNVNNIFANLRNGLAKNRPKTFETTKASILDVRLIFKFMWRKFRSLAAFICLGERICYSYNPFSEDIMQYTGKKSKYFGRSNFTIGNKNLSVVYVSPHVMLVTKYTSYVWMETNVFQKLVENYFVTYLNGSLNMSSLYIDQLMSDEAEFCSALTSKGLNEKVDLIVFGAGLRVSEPSHYDFSTAIDTASLFFNAPRNGYWPQSLVAFKSFDPQVWMMILFASAFSVFVHRQFGYWATRSFRFLFKEIELTSCGYFPHLWSVYCYFLCVYQPRLQLNRLQSGKVLFLTMTFTSLILATLFQSEMVTLLSRRVRYSDINTIDDLEKSDLEIQSTDLEKDRTLFGTKYRSINERLTDTYTNLHKLMDKIIRFANKSFNESSNPEMSLYNSSAYMSELMIKLNEQRDEIEKTSAFMSSVPFQLDRLSRDVLLYVNPTSDRDLEVQQQGHEQHFVYDGIMTFPFSYAFPKYSIFAKTFSDHILMLAATGLLKHVIDEMVTQPLHTLLHLGIESELFINTVRTFTIADLGGAFIALACGLLLSYLFFIIELLSSLLWRTI